MQKQIDRLERALALTERKLREARGTTIDPDKEAVRGLYGEL
jgi:hypothetical protein